MVHFVCALLASGAAGTDSLSLRLAVVSAVAAYWHHAQRGIRPGPCLALSSSSSPRMEEMIRLRDSRIKFPPPIQSPVLGIWIAPAATSDSLRHNEDAMRRCVPRLLAMLACGSAADLRAVDVGLIKIDGPIGPATASFIARAIDLAGERKDACLIIQLDTPGGLVSSTEEIV